LDEDTNRWFLLGGTGCSQHQHHPRQLENSIQKVTELTPAFQRDIVEYAEASSSITVAQRIASFKSGIHMTTDQIHYMLSKHRTSQLDKVFSGSSADQLITYLKSQRDISFMCLFDSVETKVLSTTNKGQPTKAQKLYEMSQMSLNNNPQDECFFNNQQDGDDDLPIPNKKSDIFEQELTGMTTDAVFLSAKETREALMVKDSKQLLLDVAFVCDDEQRIFECFPEVTFWDTALKTNREKRLLFLPCGKNSENKTFRYLGPFMPNKCRWVFDWLYLKAMPQLLGTQVLQCTNLSLTDGEKNEYGPLETQL
jgi:hypothetical protein